MNKIEFDEWWKYHCTKFPGIIGWLKKFPSAGQAAEHEPSQSDIRKSWFEDLRKFDLAECTRATDVLHRRGSGTKGFGDHPRFIRGICYGDRDQALDNPPEVRWRGGEPQYVCPQCQHVWMLVVWSPATISNIRKALARGEKPEYHQRGMTYTCAVACDCEWGRRKNNRLKRPNLVYAADNPLMIITDRSEESFAELVEAVESNLCRSEQKA